MVLRTGLEDAGKICLPFNFLCPHVEPGLSQLQGSRLSLNGGPELVNFLGLGSHLGEGLVLSLLNTVDTVAQQVQLLPQVRVGLLPVFDQVSTEGPHQGLDISPQLLRVISSTFNKYKVVIVSEQAYLWKRL